MSQDPPSPGKGAPAGTKGLAARLSERFSLQLVRWTAPIRAASGQHESHDDVLLDAAKTGNSAMTEQEAALSAIVQETYQYLFDEAHRALLQGGSFVPFGAGVRPSGERTHLNVDLPFAQSKPQDHIAGLIAAFRQEAGDDALTVAGLILDGGMQTPDGDSPAMVVHMEASNGESVQVTIPYERLMERGEIRFKEPVVSHVSPEIFAAR